MATQYTGGQVAGGILTAATMNSIGAAWETYTPVFKTGATTRTATVTYARYSLVQKLLTVQVELSCTEIGTASSVLTVSLPSIFTYVRPAGTSAVVGTFSIVDSGTAFYTGAAMFSASAPTPVIAGTAYNSTDFMGAAAPAMTIAVGDKVSFTATIEIV